MNLLQKSGFNQGQPGITRFEIGHNPFKDCCTETIGSPIKRFDNKRSRTLDRSKLNQT